LWLWLSGLLSLRLAARRLLSLLLKLPPRITRLEAAWPAPEGVWAGHAVHDRTLAPTSCGCCLDTDRSQPPTLRPISVDSR
jgi:hypothetical protein